MNHLKLPIYIYIFFQFSWTFFGEFILRINSTIAKLGLDLTNITWCTFMLIKEEMCLIKTALKILLMFLMVILFLQQMWHAAWTVRSRWAAVPSPVLKTQRVTQMACTTSASPFSTVLLNLTLRYVRLYTIQAKEQSRYISSSMDTQYPIDVKGAFSADSRKLRSNGIGWILSNESCRIPLRSERCNGSYSFQKFLSDS